MQPLRTAIWLGDTEFVGEFWFGVVGEMQPLRTAIWLGDTEFVGEFWFGVVGEKMILVQM